MVRNRSIAGLAAQGVLGAWLILASACAPTVQSALPRAGALDPPGFDVQAQRFQSFDGARLGLSAWIPEGEEPWAVIVGLHGMNDYGEAFSYAGPWFAARGVAVYAYDARGFGRSPHRGLWAGEQLMSEDLRAAIAAVRRLHPDATLAVVGDSMGAAEAITSLSAPDAPEVDRIVLVAPAVWGWSALPDVYAGVLWLAAHTLPGRAISPPRNLNRVPSDNIDMLRALGRDQNMIFRTRIDAIYGLVRLMEQAAQDIGALDAPTAFLYGENDQIVPRDAAEAAAARLPADARTALYPNGYHMLLRDLQAEIVYEDVLSFLRDPAAPFPSDPEPVIARSAIQANR